MDVFTSKKERAVYFSVGPLEAWVEWRRDGRSYGWEIVAERGSRTFYAGRLMIVWARKIAPKLTAAH